MRFRNVCLLLTACLTHVRADDTVNELDTITKSLEGTIFKVIETGLNGVDVVPIEIPDTSTDRCSVTSSVTCIITATGEDCEDLFVPIEECGDMELTFDYKYCSKEDRRDVRLFPELTTALIETVPVDGLNYNNLSPKRCHEFSITREVDTCKRFFSASLKVEGRRGNAENDYCYAWDFMRIFVKRRCDISSQVASCKVDATGEDCNDFVVPLDECVQDQNMTFTFEYCNNEDTPLKFRRQKTTALVETNNIPGLVLSDLNSGACQTLSISQPINTCKRFFSASLKVEGWRGDKVGDYCFAYDHERIFIPRPDDPPRNDKSCNVSSKVKCTITGTGDECDDIIVPYEDCDGDTEMTFEFEFCNFEQLNNINLLGGKKTIAKIETSPVLGLDVNTLSPGECRTYRESRKIDTCKRFFSASLKVEGRRGDDYGDYCYAYDFYRSYIERPPTDNTPPSSPCNISADITCTVDETGQECEDIVVPLEDCQPDVDMTFSFEYCSGESEHIIDLKEDLTRARIETVNVPGLNKNNLSPGDCRRLFVSRSIDTCKNFFSAQLKVEGIREDVGGYCYAWDFYRSYVNRLVKPPTPSNPGPTPSSGDDCAVSAEVTCTLARTGQACEDIVVPLEECLETEDMIFEFEWCNYEVSREIYLISGKTRALVETVPVNNLNLNPLAPGNCHRRIVTRQINTCKKFFSASLKVEGKKGEGPDDYCYAYDFYRSYIDRFTPDIGTPPSPINEPTPAQDPTPANEPTPACQVTAEISCIVAETGADCDDIIVPLDQCQSDVQMMFSFKYCSLESDNDINLKDDLTTALIETINVDGLDLSDLAPGECRIKTETREIDTCKRFFSSSLKIEGVRNEEVDYCYAWDFYRSYISRPQSLVPTPVTDCELTTEVECTYDLTGESCDKLTISDAECSEAEQMTFDFRYCSNEQYLEINLRQDKTEALVETIPVSTMDKSPLRPGECRRLRAKRKINTCKRFFSAGLKVEGTRPGVEGYCFGYDHYRAYISRPGVPTAIPTKRPTISPTLSVGPTPLPTGCSVTGIERETRIRRVIDSISDASYFEDAQSPQSLARNWLINEDTYNVFCAKACSRSGSDGGVFQRYALAVFYFSTFGDNWFTCGKSGDPGECIPKLTNIKSDPVPTISDNKLWLSPVNECAWGGLACKAETECLDRIEFEANNVSGTIPKEIEQFNTLRYLYLEGAQGDPDYENGALQFISGQIPPEVETLGDLLILDLNYNKLEGQIPDGIYNMQNLRHLDINHNMLTGEISGDIGNLVNLRFLQLDNNIFSGEIPAEIANAQNLINADFHRNNFTGNMPGRLCTLLGAGYRLNRLSADCGGNSPEVQCPCCTRCFEDSMGEIGLTIETAEGSVQDGP